MLTLETLGGPMLSSSPLAMLSYTSASPNLDFASLYWLANVSPSLPASYLTTHTLSRVLGTEFFLISLLTITPWRRLIESMVLTTL